MGLQDAMRKAAGLFIETAPDESAPPHSGAQKEDAATPVDINELLAEKGLGPLARAQ